jgi:hypothetical protein
MSDDDDGIMYPDDWSPGRGCVVSGGILIFWGLVIWLIVLWLRSTV